MSANRHPGHRLERRRWPWLALLWLGLLAPLAAQAAVRAWLDRDRVALGETVTLNVQAEGAGAATPDFSALEADFSVLGSSSSSQISISNGQRSASTLFAVALEPRREGVLTVPALDVGGERTQPLVLTVTPSSVSATPGGDLFIEVEASPRDPYVQQQVNYTLRLFYAITVLDGQLQEPAPDGARVTRLGSDRTYQAERDGRRYSVVERHFALVPERSGELRLDAPRFSGRGMDRNGLGGMFGGGVRLNASGEALTLQVRPRPTQATEPWLPARGLSLSMEPASLPTSGKVGEPISLTLRLRARGLAAEQLPELRLPEIAGATVYPDQESSSDPGQDAELAGMRERRFAIVPTRPGELVIPELRQSWWNVDSDQAATARIGEQRLRIAPSAAATAAAAAPVAPAPSAAETGRSNPDATSAPAAPAWSSPWMWLSLLLAAGWLITAWRARRAPRSLSPPPSASMVAGRRGDPQRLRQALQGGDLSDIALALRALAPAGCGAGLDAIAAALEDAEQRAAVLQLDRCLYASDGDRSVCRDALRAAFRQAPRWGGLGAAAAGDASLPPLYRS